MKKISEHENIAAVRKAGIRILVLRLGQGREWALPAQRSGCVVNDDRVAALLMHPIVHVHRCAHCHDPRDADKKYCNRCLEWAEKHTEILKLVRQIKR